MPRRRTPTAVDRYMNEPILFCGELVPRREVIRWFRAEGHPERCIQIWLFGNKSATEHHRRRRPEPRDPTRPLLETKAGERPFSEFEP